MTFNTPSPAALKVMHVLGSKGAGGAETFFIRLVSALQDGNSGVEVLPVVRTNSWASAQLTELGIDHRTAPFGGMFDITTTRIIKQCIHGFKPNIIQSWMSRATKFLPKTSLPTAARLGGYYNLKYYKNKVKYLIGNTQDIVKYTRKNNWPEAHSVYIPNFTNTPADGYKEQKQLVRDRYGISEHDFVILMAGRLHECKGFDLILHVLTRLPKHVHILIVGNGGEKKSFEAAVDADNLNSRVHFVPWVNNITPMAAASDVWAIPSRIEPLGNTVLDAWGHQIPAVASRAIGPKELITDGENGLLFDIDDADGAEATLMKIINNRDLSKTLSTNGFDTLKNNFSQEIVLKQYIDFYKKITKDSKND